MVLPGFIWQNNNHTHTWGAWMSNGDGTHTHACACSVTETVNCSGGTATCKERAVCDVCKAEYGATAGKTDLAKKAKALNLDAIHDTVHEMARDEARHGKALKGLLERYFK